MRDAFGVEHGEVAKAARYIKTLAAAARETGSAAPGTPNRLRVNAYNFGRRGGDRGYLLSGIDERGAESAKALRTMRGQRRAGTRVGEGVSPEAIERLPGFPAPVRPAPKTPQSRRDPRAL